MHHFIQLSALCNNPVVHIRRSVENLLDRLRTFTRLLASFTTVPGRNDSFNEGVSIDPFGLAVQFRGPYLHLTWAIDWYKMRLNSNYKKSQKGVYS